MVLSSGHIDKICTVSISTGISYFPTDDPTISSSFLFFQLGVWLLFLWFCLNNYVSQIIGVNHKMSSKWSLFYLMFMRKKNSTLGGKKCISLPENWCLITWNGQFRDNGQTAITLSRKPTCLLPTDQAKAVRAVHSLNLWLSLLLHHSSLNLFSGYNQTQDSFEGLRNVLNECSKKDIFY